MNKTITINLGGINFYIDEDAYIRLDNYLKSISASLDPESREETLQDIEARIAELFLEQQHDKSRVIQMQSIEEVIKIMGQPEDYRMEDEEAPKTAEPQKTGTAKKLYRDIEHRTIGGVCAGLGYYFGIERIWVRIIFLLLFLPILTSKFLVPSSSTVFLIYVILWIVVPAARTTSQKLEMQGEKIDINNIQRKVREEYDTIKKKVNSTSYNSHSFFDKLGNFLMAILKVCFIIVGILIVIMAGFGLLVVLINGFSFGASSIFELELPYFIGGLNVLPYWLTYIVYIILSGIPLLLLLFVGLKIINPNSKPIGLTGVLILIGIWALGWVPFIFYNSPEHRQPPMHALEENQLTVKDTLFIQNLNPDTFGNSSNTKSREPKLFSKNIHLNVQKTTKDNRLNVFKTLQTDNRHDQNVKRLTYKYTIQEDSIFLDIHSSTPASTGRLRKLEITNTLFLNEGVIFKIDSALSPILDDFPKSYLNQFVQFKNGKIVCEDCPEKVDDTLQEEEKDSLQQENDSINTADKTNQNDQWYQESDSI